jgi:hypothetical protein
VYVFKYGAVCFLNYKPIDISEFLTHHCPLLQNLFENSLTDEFLIQTGSKELRVGFDKLIFHRPASMCCGW